MKVLRPKYPSTLVKLELKPHIHGRGVLGLNPGGHLQATFDPMLPNRITNNSQPNSVPLMKKDFFLNP